MPFSDPGIFYFTLGNIHPRFRSQLSMIYLVAITKQKNIGMDAVISPFVDDIKKLVCFEVTAHNYSFENV